MEVNHVVASLRNRENVTQGVAIQVGWFLCRTKYLLQPLRANKIISFIQYDIIFLYKDGNWGDWSTWSTCSNTCGEGYNVRSRQCNNPIPSNGGSPCEGDGAEQRHCNDRPCPVGKNTQSELLNLFILERYFW